jgi:hypothetical protein
MRRRIDHLVICVRDLAQAALDWRTLGFNLTPAGVHPFGTSNRLALFGNNFLELLAVTDVAAIPPAAPGGALRVIEVVMSAREPMEHRGFLERFTESAAELAPGRLTVGESGDRITVLGPAEMARRLPGLACNTSPRFCAARLAVIDLDATRRTLKDNGVDFEVTAAVLLVPPAASHGLALEFVEQETI